MLVMVMTMPMIDVLVCCLKCRGEGGGGKATHFMDDDADWGRLPAPKRSWLTAGDIASVVKTPASSVLPRRHLPRLATQLARWQPDFLWLSLAPGGFCCNLCKAAGFNTSWARGRAGVRAHRLTTQRAHLVGHEGTRNHASAMGNELGNSSMIGGKLVPSQLAFKTLMEKMRAGKSVGSLEGVQGLSLSLQRCVVNVWHLQLPVTLK